MQSGLEIRSELITALWPLLPSVFALMKVWQLEVIILTKSRVNFITELVVYYQTMGIYQGLLSCTFMTQVMNWKTEKPWCLTLTQTYLLPYKLCCMSITPMFIYFAI